MKTQMPNTLLFAIATSLLVGNAVAAAAIPLSSAVSFQGQLKDAGAPADGDYDMRFSLFDAASAGGTVAGPLVFDGVGGNPPPIAVSSGLFQVELDFGSAFDGAALWLSIEVRPHGTGGYTTLSPRQPLTAAPYALYALDGPGQAGFWQANGSAIHKTNSGNVGIGATDPQANLEVRASGTPRLRIAKIHTGGFGVTSSAVLELKSNFTGTDKPYGIVNFLDGNNAVRGSIEYGNDAGLLAPSSLRLKTAGQTRMAITDAGDVGIGTTDIPTGVRLAVRGKVLAEEIEVQLSQNWPDYVFADDYDLMPLPELEQRIRDNGHLPGIPPAAEVKAGGLPVGAMQVKLMEKVEELTLYVLQINRELEDVKDRNAQLERQLTELRGGRVAE